MLLNKLIRITTLGIQMNKSL